MGQDQMECHLCGLYVQYNIELKHIEMYTFGDNESFEDVFPVVLFSMIILSNIRTH